MGLSSLIMNPKYILLRTGLFWWVQLSGKGFEEDSLFNNLNITVNKANNLNVVSNCGRFPVEILKQLNFSFTTWDGSEVDHLLKMANKLRGYKSDVLVACWKPTLGHLHTLVESFQVPSMHLRWIYLTQERNATLPEEVMSKIFRRVGCRAVIVTTTAAYVPLDTYTGCSSGVRPLRGPGDNPFEDRSLVNLTVLRNIWETNLLTRKDWRKSFLEPQNTIVRNILRKSGASISDGGDFERFGVANEHSLFTGAVGAIQTKQRDLGSFEVYLSQNIWYAVDIAGQVRFDALTFLSPLPTAITDLAIIGRPFTLSLWMSVWASLGIYLVLLVVIITTHSDAEQPPKMSEEAVDIFFGLCSALVNHTPSLQLSKRSSIRILVGFWFLFAIVMSAGFTAMLTSYTNFPPRTRPIKTLDQLSRALDSGRIKVCSVGNRYVRDVVTYHLSRNSGLLKERLEDALRGVQCADALCCLEKVAAGTHVFFTNREEARLHTGRTFRGAVRADQDFVLVHVVMIAPRSSPYSRAFAQVSQRSIETGVSAFSLKLQKFRHIRSTATWKAKVNRGKHRPFRVLHLKDLYGMFVVWGFGLALALCVLLCEIACGTLRKSRVGKLETRKAMTHGKEDKDITGSRSTVSSGMEMYSPLLFFGFPKHASSIHAKRIGKGPHRVYVAVGKQWFGKPDPGLGRKEKLEPPNSRASYPMNNLSVSPQNYE